MRREKTETSGAAKVASMLQSVPHKMEEEEKEKEEGSGNCKKKKCQVSYLEMLDTHPIVCMKL